VQWALHLFPWLTWPGCGSDHPPPSSAKVKERVELYLYSPSGPLWPVLLWTLLFTFTYCTDCTACFMGLGRLEWTFRSP
jgi:hypothetical protein